MATTEEIIPVPPPITTVPFHAIPPAPRHAVSTHLPGWDNAIRLGKRDPELLAQFVDMYPRFVLHRDIKTLIARLLAHTRLDGVTCFPFPSLPAAREFVRFVTAAPRTDRQEPLAASEVSIRAFDLTHRLFCVFFPVERAPAVSTFWRNTGLGISSRLAEANLAEGVEVREVPITEGLAHVSLESAAHAKLRGRIVELLRRAPLDVERAGKVVASDVLLYQSGMAAIFHLHETLRRWKMVPAKTVQVGVSFHQTLQIFEYWGAGVEFHPRGEEYEEIERFLAKETAAGRPVQAIWTEIPSNPLLTTADLARLRALADRHGCVLVIDDTVGSFANVDVLGIADIIVTSLTKSFSGYADVMGGSVVLNPSSAFYAELQPLFATGFETGMFSADAEALVKNSENYLERSTILNRNAQALVDYLHTLVDNSCSSVARVFYPSVSPTRPNFDAVKRPATEEFEPGYGCLFSVEFERVEAAIAFYDNLRVHNGPHLGAHRTIALVYVKAMYVKDLERVAPWGMKETQIRISVGLEEIEELLGVFKYALQLADAANAAAGR